MNSDQTNSIILFILTLFFLIKFSSTWNCKVKKLLAFSIQWQKFKPILFLGTFCSIMGNIEASHPVKWIWNCWWSWTRDPKKNLFFKVFNLQKVVKSNTIVETSWCTYKGKAHEDLIDCKKFFLPWRQSWSDPFGIYSYTRIRSFACWQYPIIATKFRWCTRDNKVTCTHWPTQML